ncbi:MAG TPA: hypothetical protein VEH80_05215 [Candidatus Bathyarchaeia archaeon]|nr:hypothetical protein [Candidatus Bathyarchaeia archaeon]
MIRVAVVALLAVAAALLPAGRALAQDVRSDPNPNSSVRPPTPGLRPPPGFRPPVVRPPFPVFPCCVGYAYLPAPPPVVVPTAPPVIYVTPSPPPLVYVPAPRAEPTPEVEAPGGRWVRHGNGLEYPYRWVFEPTPSR